MSLEEKRDSLEKHVGEHAIIYTTNNFRFECIIIKVGESIIEIQDTKKGYRKILQIESISEVDFL